MPTLVPCPSCSLHVKTRETACPHCGARISSGRSRTSLTAGAVLVGLTLAGCGDDKKTSESDTASTETTTSTTTDTMTSVGPTVEPAYGVPTTVPETETETDTDTDTETDTDDEPTTPEPDYGVPATTSP